MIPQTLTRTGAYADVWTQLKSIAYSLDRVHSIENPRDISPLDKAKLLSLAELLEKGIKDRSQNDFASLSAFSDLGSYDFNYSLEIEISHALNEISEFRDWLKSQKTSFKDKISKLIAAIRSYVDKASEILISTQRSSEEFLILQSLLRNLILRTEARLYIS